MPVAARIAKLTLTDFRSYARVTIEPGEGVVVLTGPNGAGKTNLLEAVSMLAPGRGLRGASLADMARLGGSGGWAVAARADGAGGVADLGTGVEAHAPERRAARVNGAGAALAQFGERLAMSWLTPAMDRLLAEGAGARRRFLDRLTLALEPGHGVQATRYEAAMRERTRLLTGDAPADPRWLDALEARMAEHGALLAVARARTVAALGPHLAAVGQPFPVAAIAYADEAGGALAGELRRRRGADRTAGRATFGPHRADLDVALAATGAPAARCSTGEQKALLIGVLLAHAELVADARGLRPVLLLDEVAAHLDAERRAALFGRLPALGQVWTTGTDAALFATLAHATRFRVEAGAIGRCDG